MDLKGIFLLCKNHLLHLSLFHSLSISQCFLFLPYRQDSDTYYTHFEQRGIEAYIGSISCFYTTCIFVLLIRIRFIYICFEFFILYGDRYRLRCGRSFTCLLYTSIPFLEAPVCLLIAACDPDTTVSFHKNDGPGKRNRHLDCSSGLFQGTG